MTSRNQVRKTRGTLALLAILGALTTASLSADEKEAAAERPLVYALEKTGSDFPAPPLPAIAELPTITPLTDPFMWSDGSGSAISFDDFKRCLPSGWNGPSCREH